MQAVSLVSPQTLNMYTYCGNDPVNYTDPSGLFFGKLFKWIGKAFNVLNKILKWIAVVVVVILVVAFVVYTAGGGMPAFLGGGNGLLGILGKIAGKIGAGVSSFMAKSIGVSIGTVAGGSLAGALYSVGAVANSLSQDSKARRGSKFPCPPSFGRIAARFSRLFVDLLENHSGHQTDSPLENGGWVYQRRNGDLFFLRAENSVRMGGSPAGRYSDAIELSNPPRIANARVIARVHTHPYTEYEQNMISQGRAYGGPSRGYDDVNSARDQMPSIVIHQTGQTNGVAEIAIEIANPDVKVLPDKNCTRR